MLASDKSSDTDAATGHAFDQAIRLEPLARQGTRPVLAEAQGQVFNLSNDCALSHMVGMIAKTSGITPPNVCVPEWPLRLFVKLVSPLVWTPLTQDRIDALVRHTYYSTNKLRDILGFVPKHDIPAAVCHMFDEKLNE